MKTMLLPALMIALLAFTACSEDSSDVQPIEEEERLKDFNIWSGESITFSKASGADPALAQNQDRITAEVWITRGNDGGQIYNAAVESEADKTTSPLGTLWAIGEIEEIPDLDFQPFRAALGRPKDIVGQNLVMKLVEADAYVYVKITSWDQQKLGGFSYERSTQ